ncbi:4-amino-4-deoxychorismate lyase [Salipiger abyssi]|uniref:Probable branched-chain-amino-acid aminotransferase n=2 Tax=Salipiger abyssi TaxID=1250539 RepID=A0A1P8UW88_9RHOB|nr:4-amino-4-deoxychorismate lyase [Salipiger abyssi]
MIETMLWLPGSGIVREELHLARAERSCAALGFAWDASAVSLRLWAVQSDAPLRLRMTIGRNGDVELTHQPFDLGSAPELAHVRLAPDALDPDDPFLRLKTTRRARYDSALRDKPEGVYEVLFFNSRGELCEGAFTNVFLRIGGRMLTPAVPCGLLPGVLRESLLLTGEADEAVLTRADLERAERLWIGNSLRGLIPATLV